MEDNLSNLLTHFPELTPSQINQFNKLELIYSQWNEKINVISRKDIHNFYSHHLLHSLSIAKVIKFAPNQTILDVGTGGGFPGIPLSILFPETKFTLIDSIGKKIAVVNAIINELEIKNTVAIKARAEEINTKFDFIVSRAVTSMPKFVTLIKKNFLPLINKEMGLYYLKGGDLSDELQDFPKAKIFNISEYFDEPFFESKKVIFLSSQYIV